MAEFTQSCNIIPSPSLSSHVPPLPTTSRGVGSQLSTNPQNPSEIIYASGKFVVVRDVTTQSAWVYRGHNADVTSCKFSPNGNYIASCDATGKLRVWASNTPDKKSKLEVQALGGPINDVCWDGESKKIVVCGDGGSGAHVRCLIWDSGNNCGEFVGHNKRSTTVSYKPNRPYRIMSGGEDFKAVFYAGPPFKRESEVQGHTNYVNCVRYSPDGERIVSVGSDKKVCFYDGKTGALEKCFEGVHQGSIYTVTWFPSSDKILTTSADKTSKVISVPSGEVLSTYTLGSALSSFCVGGCLATSTPTPLILTLDGNLHLLTDPTTPTTIHGHQGSVKCMSFDSTEGTLYTGGGDGRVIKWTKNDNGCYVGTPATGGKNADMNNAVHGGSLTSVSLSVDSVVTSGWDDVFRVTGKSTMNTDGVVSLGGQPKASGSDSTTVVIATKDTLHVVEGGEIVKTKGVEYSTQTVAVKGGKVAVADDKNSIHIYELSSMSETNVVTGHTGIVNSLEFNSDGSKLAAGDVKEVRIWNTSDWTPEIKGRWQFHTSRITSLSWSPNGEYVASVGTDENLFIWCLAKKMKRLNYKFANKGGCNGVEWTDEGKVVTCGEDGCIAEWDIANDLNEKFK